MTQKNLLKIPKRRKFNKKVLIKLLRGHSRSKFEKIV